MYLTYGISILSCYFPTHDPLTFSPAVSKWLIIQAVWGEAFATWVNKKKKRRHFFRPDQMPLHTRFPWIRAVTWQRWCLSVVMETSVSEHLRGILADCWPDDRERGGRLGVTSSSVCLIFMSSGKCSTLQLHDGYWELFYCDLKMPHYHRHYNCHICSSGWCCTFRQDVQSETGSAHRDGRSVSHVSTGTVKHDRLFWCPHQNATERLNYLT